MANITTCVSFVPSISSHRMLSWKTSQEQNATCSPSRNSCCSPLQLSFNNSQVKYDRKTSFVVHAAWTRRSKSEAAKHPNKKSWKQRTDKYMRPFLLDVFISKKYIHAKVTHRVTSKTVAVATTNARDLRTSLPSLTDLDACRTIAKLIAERAKEADVYAIAYEPRKGERVEGKLGLILDTIKENEITIV